MKKKAAPIEWHKVERLCLLSFTGQRLSDDEHAVIQDAYAREPEEYRRRTEAIRDGERSRLRSI